MKRPSPFPLPDTIQPDRSHNYLDFRVGRGPSTSASAAAASAGAAGAAAAGVPPSLVGGGGGKRKGVSALSLSSSPYSTNVTTTTQQSCFANFGTSCSFGSTDSCSSWMSSTSNPTTTTIGGAAAVGTTTTSTEDNVDENDGDDDDANIDDPTTIIAKQMNQLSIDQRQLAFEEIHGVSNTIQETPEFISRALLQFEIELDKIPKKLAYELAKTIQMEYVQNTKLRIKFLRSVRFNILNSVKRFVGWLDWKLQLFGPEKLCQPHINLNDLSEDAQWVVESGLYQIVPVRDSCNRPILFISNHYTNRFFKSKHAAYQMIFYILMNIAEDESNNMIYIIYNLESDDDDKKEKEEMIVDQSKTTSSSSTTTTNQTTTTTNQINDTTTSSKEESPNDADFIWKISDLSRRIPHRPAAMHCITKASNGVGGPMKKYWLSWLAKSLERHVQTRLRIHYGSHIESIYALTSFGIPISYLPITSDGELKLTNHKKWIQRQRIKETEIQRQQQQYQIMGTTSSTSYIFNGIELPQNNDVLLGQGKPLQGHPGNKRLLDIIQTYLEEYNCASRVIGRAEVARKVIQEIYSSGGRFLKLRSDDTYNNKSSGWWEVVTDENVILEKVRNGFRNSRRPKKKK